jgi:urea transport system substrate-binding protein
MLSRRDFLKATGLGAATLLGSGTLLAACGTEDTGAGGDGEPFKLGALIPLTGIEDHVGQSMQVSTEIAVAEINEAGGILGRQIELIIEDEASDPATAVERARKLIREDEVTFIVGTLISAVRNAVVEFTAPESVPLFNPTYYEGGLCQEQFLSTGALPNQQIEPFVPWILDNLGSSFYFIGSDYEWPRGSYAHIRRLVEEGGGEILGEEYVPFGVTDYSASIRRILDEEPDVLYPLIAGVDGITFWNQLAGFDFQGHRASHSISEAITQALEPDVANGLISAAPYFMVVDNEANRQFLEKYHEERPDAYVDTFGEAMYSSVHLLAIGAERAGSLENEPLLEGLRGASFDAPKGRVTIDPETQHASTAFHIAEAKGNGWDEFEILVSEEGIEPAADCGAA